MPWTREQMAARAAKLTEAAALTRSWEQRRGMSRGRGRKGKTERLTLTPAGADSALVLVDGAQLVPHVPTDVKAPTESTARRLERAWLRLRTCGAATRTTAARRLGTSARRSAQLECPHRIDLPEVSDNGSPPGVSLAREKISRS
jgi:hypothetical protein